MIDWNPVDILTCLETQPAVDEESTSYRYTLSRDGLVLALEIWPYDGSVLLGMRLHDREQGFVDLRMEGCREVRYRVEKERELISFVSHEVGSQYPANFRDGWQLQVRPRVELLVGVRPAG